jgi:hypothetical protein
VEVTDREGGSHIFGEKAHSIAPAWIEEAIQHGIKEYMVVGTEPRTIHVGELEIVTTPRRSHRDYGRVSALATGRGHRYCHAPWDAPDSAHFKGKVGP